MDAIEYTVANTILDNKPLADGNYNLSKSGNICLDIDCTKELSVEVKGEMPKSGNLTVLNGKIYSIFMNFDDKKIAKYGTSELQYATYDYGTPMYFNVTTGKECKSTEAVSTMATKSGCMKFYVINDLGGALDLLLDHNTSATIEWTDSSTNVNQNGPMNLINQLYNDTKDWNGVLTPIDYTIDQSNQPSAAKYTLKYSQIPEIPGATTPYKARLITANEISNIVGYKSWDDRISTKFYYFDSLTTQASSSCTVNNTIDCNYGWLYDRTSTICTNYGCLNNSNVNTSGYWIATSSPESLNKAWCVYFSGRITSDIKMNSTSVGVRPVITVLKNKFKN